MGKQLIFCVESNSKDKSDWIYIKDTLDRYYIQDNAHVKYSVEFMNGKGNYKTTALNRKIENKIKQYTATQKNNMSTVIFVVDTDDCFSNPVDKKFLEDIRSFCETKEYELVWFCKDIEQVYLNVKVPNTKKKDEAVRFRKNNLINGIDSELLENDVIKNRASNVLRVLDKYLKRR